jgi:hypothetical protein
MAQGCLGKYKKATATADVQGILANIFFGFSQMRLFHPVNSLAVSRNLWLILLSKI